MFEKIPTETGRNTFTCTHGIQHEERIKMWSIYLAVLLFLPTARSLPKKPVEEKKERNYGETQFCPDCLGRSKKGSADNSSVEGEFKEKKNIHEKNQYQYSERLRECDKLTQIKSCRRWERKLSKSQERYNRKSKCRSSICCKGKLYRKQYGKSTSCCGMYMYDSSRNKCCWDTAEEKHGANCCKNVTLDKDCYSCKHGIITARFDVDTSICCEGHIYNISVVGRDVKCCGNEVHIRDIDCHNAHTLSSNIKYILVTNVMSAAREIDFKEQAENGAVQTFARNNSELRSSTAHFVVVVFAVIVTVAALVTVSVFIYIRKVKNHKTAGNHAINIEPGTMTSKDTSLEIVTENETILTKGNKIGNSLQSIENCQSVACFELHYIKDFHHGEVLEEYIHCSNGDKTLSGKNCFRTFNCMEDKSNGPSKNILISISSKDRTEHMHEDIDELDHTSYANRSQLNYPHDTHDVKTETNIIKECKDRHSFSSVKSCISLVLSECKSESYTSDFTDEEYHSTNSGNVNQVDAFTYRHPREIVYHDNSVSGELAKDISIDSRNLTALIWRETGSQTMQDNNTKKLNIFGDDWTLHGTFNATGGLLRCETTSVELFVPQGLFDVFSASEVHGSVYTKIGALRQKFNISENLEIVGPGVEFLFPTLSNFNKHVVVKIPYFGDCDISVYWFASDSGSMEKSTLQMIEPRSKYNNANQDMYCQIGGDGFVYIFTKHFSGFLCTRCTCDKCSAVNRRELTLYGVVFGSYKSFDGGRQVRIRLYIADGKAKLDGFMQEYAREESSKGRELIEIREIGLVPDVLESCDILSMRLEVMDDEDGLWINKKKRSGQPLTPDVQFLQLSRIVRCCRQDDYPAFVEWFLENNHSGENITFQCFIEIDVTVTNTRNITTFDNTPVCSTIIIEGLRMQKKCEEEVIRQCEKVRGILSRLLDVKTSNMLLQELGVDVPIKSDRKRESIGNLEPLLLRCQKKYGPGLFLAMTESVIRKLNIPCILEEIGSCFLHECVVSGKAECSLSASSQPRLMESVEGCGEGESYARAELPFGYPSSSGPLHIPVQGATMDYVPVRDYVYHMCQTCVEPKGSDEEETVALKM